MKKTLIAVAALAALTACENRLEETVSFDATVADNAALTQNADGTFEAKVGTQVTFLFDGNADFITLKQDVFNETDATLNFDSKVSWNDNADNLSLFISTTFAGLQGDDAQADGLLVSSHEWTDISDRCTWPSVRNDEQHTAVDLSAYRGQDVVLAFRYKTSDNSGFQPMFTISDLRINNRIIKTGLQTDSVVASNMGLRALDMLQLESDSAAYANSTAQGTWDTSNPNSIVIRQSTKGRDLNEDWLISRPIRIITGKVSELDSHPIKNFYLDIDSYDYEFTETGTYTLTFRAANANYKHQSTTEKTFTFIISE